LNNYAFAKHIFDVERYYIVVCSVILTANQPKQKKTAVETAVLSNLEELDEA